MKKPSYEIVRGNFPLCFEKAHANVLENIPLIIYRDELFVGECASKPWGAEIAPFLGIWKEDAIRGAYAGSGLCLSFNFTDCYTDFVR